MFLRVVYIVLSSVCFYPFAAYTVKNFLTVTKECYQLPKTLVTTYWRREFPSFPQDFNFQDGGAWFDVRPRCSEDWRAYVEWLEQYFWLDTFQVDICLDAHQGTRPLPEYWGMLSKDFLQPIRVINSINRTLSSFSWVNQLWPIRLGPFPFTMSKGSWASRWLILTCTMTLPSCISWKLDIISSLPSSWTWTEQKELPHYKHT